MLHLLHPSAESQITIHLSHTLCTREKVRVKVWVGACLPHPTAGRGHLRAPRESLPDATPRERYKLTFLSSELTFLSSNAQ